MKNKDDVDPYGNEEGKEMTEENKDDSKEEQEEDDTQYDEIEIEDRALCLNTIGESYKIWC